MATDRFGIDLGNILSTASNIKTARLNREIKQGKLDKEKARVRNALSRIKKDQESYNLVPKIEPVEEVEVLSEEEFTKKKSPNRNTKKLTEQEIHDYAIDSDSYDKLIAKENADKLLERQYNLNLSTLQSTLPNITQQQRENLARLKTSELKTYMDMIVNADDRKRKIAKENLDVMARELFNITQLDGVSRKDAYIRWRNNKILATPKEQQKKVMDSIPDWDENTMNWIGQTLATSKDTFDTLNKIEAEKNAQKAKNEFMLKKNSIKNAPKTSDYSLVEKIAIRNTTGLDVDNPNDSIAIAELDQSVRDKFTDLSARASRIYKDGNGSITHAEAVQQASQERAEGKSLNKSVAKSKVYKKNGVMYKLVDGKLVKI